MKITTYFETYYLIDLKQFDNIQQAENYFLLNNGCGKHQKRKKIFKSFMPKEMFNSYKKFRGGK